MPFDVSIKKENDYILVKVAGEYDTKEMRSYDPKMLANACDHFKCNKLLIDIQELTGKVSILENFDLGKGMATYLGLQKRVVILGTKEQSKDDFIQTVAVNRGADVKIFSNKREAIQALSKDS